MPTAALLIVGSEMLDPARPDANGPLARDRLAAIGVRLALIARVEDRIPSIAAAVTAAMASADIVVTSGGLGPTGDDLTREGVAAALGRGVGHDPGWLAELEARFRLRRRELDDVGRRQALIVGGASPIPNAQGLACGSFVEEAGRLLFLLPGVPPEFAGMIDRFVVPLLAERFPSRPRVRTVRAIAAGLPEAAAEPVLAEWYGRPGVAVSILPSLGVLKITITITEPPAGDGERLEQQARADLERGLDGHLISVDGVSLEARIGELLVAQGRTLATAESCTAGRAAHRLALVPGASRYFLGGVCAYSNRLKTDLLGVPAALIDAHGAVSEEVARAMARGARERLGADCAIAITGVAGPDGGTAAKPVGLVHFAAVTDDAEEARQILFPVDRASVMELAANYALFSLWRLLTGRDGDNRR